MSIGRTSAVAAVIVASVLAAAVAAPAYRLEVTGEDGQVLWALPVRPGISVTLVYTNSIFGARTEEQMILTPQGFTLQEVRSTSEAVLSYNGLPGPYHREGTFVAAPASVRLPELVLRIGRTGQQRLIVGGRELPLYTAGEGSRITVRVGRLFK